MYKSKSYQVSFSLALVLGLLASQHHVWSPAPVPSAHAACFAGWSACTMDVTRTTSLRVLHVLAGGSPDPVAPDTTEVWDVAAYYSPPPFSTCIDEIYYATITVWNDGSGYSYSCNGCTTGPFQAITLCDPTECADGTDYEYTIALDMLASYLNGDITAVTYTAQQIDDGETIDSNCDPIRSVSPTSQSWTDTDTTFPCSYDCDSDTTIAITYE